MADAYPDDMYYLLKLACETQSPSQVVYELDPSYWMNEQRNGSTQIFFYQDFPVSKAKSSYFMDKITGLDFRSGPLELLQEPVRTDTGEYKEKTKRSL